MTIELLGIKYYLHLINLNRDLTKNDFWNDGGYINYIGDWSEEMNKFIGTKFESADKLLEFCDKIIVRNFLSSDPVLYDVVIKTGNNSEINYKLYRRYIEYYNYGRECTKYVEIISYGPNSKGLFRDTMDKNYGKLLIFEKESYHEKREKSKMQSKQRNRQQDRKYLDL